MGRGIQTRQLPRILPHTYEELRGCGHSDWQIRRQYTRISKGVWVANTAFVDGKLDIITRGRAQHLARSDLPLTGFAALAFYGLKYWADEAEVIVASAHSAGRQCKKQQLARIECSGEVGLRNPDPLLPHLQCVEPIEALVSALRRLRKREVSWWVPRMPEWNAEEIRAIQLVDAINGLLGKRLDPSDVAESARGRIDQAHLKKVFNTACLGADSPMETLLRLLVGGMKCGGKRVHWEAQVPIFRNGAMGKSIVVDGEEVDLGDFAEAQLSGVFAGFQGAEPWLTVGDLVSKELKVVLFYDGEHHRDKRQHYRDTEIDAVLQACGWRVLRVTAPMICDGERLRSRVAALLRDAAATHGGK